MNPCSNTHKAPARPLHAALLAAVLACAIPAHAADDSAADQPTPSDRAQELNDRAQRLADHAQAMAERAQRQAEQKQQQAQERAEQLQMAAEQRQEAAEQRQEAEQQRQEGEQQRQQALQERQHLKELETLDRQAEREQLKMLKDYDITRLQREAQVAAQQAQRTAQQAQVAVLESLPLMAVSPDPMQHKHRRDSVDSGDEAGGESQINERHPLNADGRVYVNDIAGTVVVNAWEKNEVLITGSLGSSADHLEVTGDASNLSFVVKRPNHSHSSGDSDLRLMVPAGSRVEVETVSADASVRGTRGPLKITTVSGDVGVDVQSPEVAVQTVSGDVILRAPSRSTQANTVSGDLHLSGLQGKLAVDTVSGNLSVKGSSFSDLKLKSVSGDMGLDASFLPQAVVTGESLSGTITLHVPVNLSGTASIKSFSGEAQCDLPQTSEVSNTRNMHKKRDLVFGDGKGVSLQLSTFSGDVRIDRLTAPIAPPAPPAPVAPPAPPAP